MNAGIRGGVARGRGRCVQRRCHGKQAARVLLLGAVQGILEDYLRTALALAALFPPAILFHAARPAAAATACCKSLVHVPRDDPRAAEKRRGVACVRRGVEDYENDQEDEAMIALLHCWWLCEGNEVVCRRSRGQ